VSCIAATTDPVTVRPLPNKFVHKIDQSKCIKCGTCMSQCHFKAISKE
jgi:ferredoxin